MKPDQTSSYTGIKIDGVPYFSAAEVARKIGVSRQTLWRWRQERKIPAGQRYRDHSILFTTDEFEQVRQYAQRLEPADGGLRGKGIS